jgi:hypothetical protein
MWAGSDRTSRHRAAQKRSPRILMQRSVKRPARSLLPRKPRSIGCVEGEIAVIVRGAVRPPNWAPFPKFPLCGIHFETCSDSLYRILPVTYGAPGRHEFLDELGVDLLIESWITETPKATANYEISTVWRRRIVSLSRHWLGEQC